MARGRNQAESRIDIFTLMHVTKDALADKVFGPSHSDAMAEIEKLFVVTEVIDAVTGTNKETVGLKLWSFACEYDLPCLLAIVEDFLLCGLVDLDSDTFWDEDLVSAALSRMSSRGLLCAAQSLASLIDRETSVTRFRRKHKEREISSLTSENLLLKQCLQTDQAKLKRLKAEAEGLNTKVAGLDSEVTRLEWELAHARNSQLQQTQEVRALKQTPAEILYKVCNDCCTYVRPLWLGLLGKA